MLGWKRTILNDIYDNVKMGVLGLANPSTRGEILYLGFVLRESLRMGNFTDVFRLSRFALNLFLKEMFFTTTNVYTYIRVEI